MPVLAASEAILTLLLAAVGIGLIWTVGHEVERDLGALGNLGGDLSTKAMPFMIAVLVAIWLIVRGKR